MSALRQILYLFKVCTAAHYWSPVPCTLCFSCLPVLKEPTNRRQDESSWWFETARWHTALVPSFNRKILVNFDFRMTKYGVYGDVSYSLI